MMTSIFLGALPAVSARVVTPWRGVWFADVDIDLDVPVLPTGPTTLIIGTNPPMLGTIDPLGSSLFGSKAKVRVLGGGGGWQANVVSQAYHNDAFVTNALVILATAAEVGEVATVLVPTVLGVDYLRTAGPASRVLQGLDWHVDPTTGTTIVGPRLPLPVDPTSVELLDWDPNLLRATLATESILTPGSIIVDTRIGTATVHDVEQTWCAEGARALAHCSEVASKTRLAGAIQTMAREAVGLPFLKTYAYRVVSQSPIDGRVMVQPVDPTGDAPFGGPLTVWTGTSGVTAKMLPGTTCLVSFVNGDPSQPIVLGFSTNGVPTELDLNAIKVVVGLGLEPVAKAPEIATWAAAVVTALGANKITVPALAPSFTSTRLFTD